MAPISQNRGVVTEKTDKQANRLVKKRRKVKQKLEKLEQRQEEGKKPFLGKFRKKRLKKRKEKIQEKIDVNPTALKWKRVGDAKKKIEKEKTIPKPHPDPRFEWAGTKKKKGGKYKTGGFKNPGASWIEAGAASLDD